MAAPSFSAHYASLPFARRHCHLVLDPTHCVKKRTDISHPPSSRQFTLNILHTEPARLNTCQDTTRVSRHVLRYAVFCYGKAVNAPATVLHAGAVHSNSVCTAGPYNNAALVLERSHTGPPRAGEGTGEKKCFRVQNLYTKSERLSVVEWLALGLNGLICTVDR